MRKQALRLVDELDHQAIDRVVIYGLVDPRDGLIHYVGRTSAALRSRLSSHKYDVSPTWDGKARGAGQDKIKWLIAMREAGVAPTIKVLEECEASDAVSVEKRWVQSLFKAGVPLTNRQWRPKTCVDDPAWLRGVAAALVTLHRLCGHPTAVKRVLDGLEVTVEMLRVVGVEELDLRELTKCQAAR